MVFWYYRSEVAYRKRKASFIILSKKGCTCMHPFLLLFSSVLIWMKLLKESYILHMPYISVVLCDRTVWWEESCFGNVHDHLLRPWHTVFVICKYSFFCLNIILYIQKCHKPVFLNQFCMNLKKCTYITDPHHLRADDEIYPLADICIIDPWN